MGVQSKKGRERRQKDDSAKNLNALPNTFKFAAESLKIMSERGGSAGSIVVNKYKSYNYKLIYALVMNTVKNIKMIKKIIHEAKLHKKVSENNPFMLEILVGDLLYGKGLKSLEQNSTASTILGLKETIFKHQTALKKTHSSDTETTSVKYLRVNKLKSTMEHVLAQLKGLGLKQVDYSKDKIKFKKFINKFKTMDDDCYMLDFHFPEDLIILKTKGFDKLKRSDIVRKGKGMLQDKASYMAVEAMSVDKGHNVIDGCCAPGCKTSLIADKMKNTGKLLAFDIDKKRLFAAKHMLDKMGATCVTVEKNDFSKVKIRRLLKVHNIDTFDSILIDPSCSGSGIQSRVDYKASSEEIGRLKKLQAFQVSLLLHALRSGASKNIVYCTCSTSIEENEKVVEMALHESGVGDCWKIDEVLPYWPERGDSSFEFGEKCLRSSANYLTNGFFIAKLTKIKEPDPKCLSQKIERMSKVAENPKVDKKQTNGNPDNAEKITKNGKNKDQEITDDQEEEEDDHDNDDAEMSDEHEEDEHEDEDEEEDEEDDDDDDDDDESMEDEDDEEDEDDDE